MRSCGLAGLALDRRGRLRGSPAGRSASCRRGGWRRLLLRLSVRRGMRGRWPVRLDLRRSCPPASLGARPSAARAGSVCSDGSCVTDCGSDVECNGVCCDGAEMCLEGSCVAQCDDPIAAVRRRATSSAVQTARHVLEAPVSRFSTSARLARIAKSTSSVSLASECASRATRSTSASSGRQWASSQPTVGCRWTPPEAPMGATDEEIEIAGMSRGGDDALGRQPHRRQRRRRNRHARHAGHRVRELRLSADGCCTRRGVVRVVSGGCNATGR